MKYTIVVILHRVSIYCNECVPILLKCLSLKLYRCLWKILILFHLLKDEKLCPYVQRFTYMPSSIDAIDAEEQQK